MLGWERENFADLFLQNPNPAPAVSVPASAFSCSVSQLVAGYQCASASPRWMEGSGTFEQFEFFASASDQRWVEVGWISLLEVRQRQELPLEACTVHNWDHSRKHFVISIGIWLSHSKKIVATVFPSTSTKDEAGTKKTFTPGLLDTLLESGLSWLGEGREVLEGSLLAKLWLALLAKLGGVLLCKLGRVCVWVESTWELDVQRELSCRPGLLSLILWCIQLELFCCVCSYSDALAKGKIWSKVGKENRSHTWNE